MFTKSIAAALMVAAFASHAFADQWDKKTILTINQEVQIPGKTLAPGKYVFKLMDSPSNRHIVQIFDANEQHLQATVLALPNYRMQPTGDSQFGFYETPAGQPKALRSWFYPGDNFGQEFVYPKQAAVALAQVTNTPVPAHAAQSETELTAAKVTTVDKAGTETELDMPAYTPPATSAATTPATIAQEREDVVIEQLPKTGSELPLIGLLGAFSLIAAAGLRRLRG